jgi:hypothetical protein
MWGHEDSAQVVNSPHPPRLPLPGLPWRESSPRASPGPRGKAATSAVVPPTGGGAPPCYPPVSRRSVASRFGAFPAKNRPAIPATLGGSPTPLVEGSPPIIHLVSGGEWLPDSVPPPPENGPQSRHPPASPHPLGRGASRLLCACYQAEPGIPNSVPLGPESGHQNPVRPRGFPTPWKGCLLPVIRLFSGGRLHHCCWCWRRGRSHTPFFGHVIPRLYRHASSANILEIQSPSCWSAADQMEGRHAALSC